jgi:hypothetical protein
MQLLGSGAVLALVLGLSGPRVLAGPGPQYWQSLGKAKVETVAPAVQPSGVVCADAGTIPDTQTKNAWVNGRGPLATSTIGTKTECTACGTFTVMKPSWHNGRGPLQPVQFAGRHECTSACVKPAPAPTTT